MILQDYLMHQLTWQNFLLTLEQNVLGLGLIALLVVLNEKSKEPSCRRIS